MPTFGEKPSPTEREAVMYYAKSLRQDPFGPARNGQGR